MNEKIINNNIINIKDRLIRFKYRIPEKSTAAKHYLKTTEKISSSAEIILKNNQELGC